MPPVGQAAQRAPGCQLPVEFVGGYDTGFRSRTAQTPPAGGAEIDVTRVPAPRNLQEYIQRETAGSQSEPPVESAGRAPRARLALSFRNRSLRPRLW